MTFLLAFDIGVFLAIIALLFCLRGFSRDLKQPRKPIGWLVSVGPKPTLAQTVRPELKFTKSKILNAATAVGLAILLGSR